MVAATLKSEAARARYEKNQKRKQDDIATYKNVNEFTRASSGEFVANNEFCVSRPEALQLVKKKQAIINTKTKVAKEKRSVSKQKQNELFTSAYNKFLGKKKDLLAKDYLVLLKRVQQKGDSKISGLKLESLKRVFE